MENYHEFRAFDKEPEVKKETVNKPKKPSLIRQAVGSVGATIAGFTLLGGALKEGQKETEQRRIRIEELKKELAAEPDLPFVIAIDPNDPERAAKEAHIQARTEKKVKLAELERTIPEIK